MSLDPSMAAAVLRGAGEGTIGPAHPEFTPDPGMPPVTRVEVLSLQPGDRLIVHVDGAAGVSAGGAERAGHMIRSRLALDELPFDIPVLVVSPGIRVTVARPG